MFEFVGNIFQKIIDTVGAALQQLINFLPTSPFTMIDNLGFGVLLGQINYFVPIYSFIAIGQAWLVAIAVFYIYSIFARWLKAIE